MDLVPVASPQSESELSVMLCTLEAHGIPAFVRGGNFGSLYPGPQIFGYNARAIMVPGEHAAEAQEALKVLESPPGQAPPRQVGWRERLRMILETLFFGWFVPGARRRPNSDE